MLGLRVARRDVELRIADHGLLLESKCVTKHGLLRSVSNKLGFFLKGKSIRLIWFLLTLRTRVRDPRSEKVSEVTVEVTDLALAQVSHPDKYRVHKQDDILP